MGSLRNFVLLLVLAFSLSFAFSAADDKGRIILVGGKKGAWKIPSSPSETLNHWAEKTRFKVGDSLLWRYDGKSDSVLEVTKEDYEGCKTSNPILEYKDGNTRILLDRPGPFYFISGAEGHCAKGEKLVVVVLSEHKEASPAPHGSDPAPLPHGSPAVAPAPHDVAPTPTPSSSAFAFKGGFMGAFLGLGCLVGLLIG